MINVERALKEECDVKSVVRVVRMSLSAARSCGSIYGDVSRVQDRERSGSRVPEETGPFPARGVSS